MEFFISPDVQAALDTRRLALAKEAAAKAEQRAYATRANLEGVQPDIEAPTEQYDPVWQARIAMG